MDLKSVLPGSIHINSPKAQLLVKLGHGLIRLLVGHYDCANVPLKSATLRVGCVV